MGKRNAQKGGGGLARVRNAFLYSRDGLLAAWREEQGFRQVVVVASIGLCLGLWLGDGFAQKVLLVLPGMLCVIVELFNSAIENTPLITRVLSHILLPKRRKI